MISISLGYSRRGQLPDCTGIWPGDDCPCVQDGWRGNACGRRTECHGPGPEEGYPEIRAAQAGAGRRRSAHQLVLCMADIPSDLSWGEAHRGQEEAQRLWHPEPR
ncbi:RIKEN cDNA 3300001G02, isoform CRA_a [Mus musculus]|nr:RIKEN cDNA 3300001G02, isoform CRA_a [Mus musculus]